ncbi:MAG: sigma-70 family RNA polymerase sigma factor [Dokdonella sp.]|uniref:RNA polymerase sigma factor n=1 Tax=Dokdonella sp. TaxID=2291710 RepID=UPI00326594AF
MADGQIHSVPIVAATSGFGQILDTMTLERARRGDMTAYGAIYKQFGTACYNLALRVLGDPATAEDVVQDVFMKLFGGLRGFRGDAPFGAWLKRLTVNATLDVVRAKKKFRDEDPESMLDALAAPVADAQMQFDAWSLLMRLPVRARAILVLHEVEGYTHKELSSLFGQSESWSKSILSRALKRLGGSASEAGEKEVSERG